MLYTILKGVYMSFVCSVVVREDKKLLTVLFPDGRDGRAFTLKVFLLVILYSFWSIADGQKS